MLKVDFHCHTCFSADSSNSIPKLLSVASSRGIDRLAITDHNTIHGALVAKSLAPEQIILGEEIKTTKGELLAFFIKEEIPPNLSPLETIHQLKEQGAFISVSHPFDIHRSGWQISDLMEIVPQIDAIEVFNARSYQKGFNSKAGEFALQNRISGTAGSDAHLLTEVGRAIVCLPDFSNADELRQAISQGQIFGNLSPIWVHLGSGLISLSKKIVNRPSHFANYQAENLDEKEG